MAIAQYVNEVERHDEIGVQTGWVADKGILPGGSQTAPFRGR